MVAPIRFGKQIARPNVPTGTISLGRGNIFPWQSEKRKAAEIVDRRPVAGDPVTPIVATPHSFDFLETIGFRDEGDEFAASLHMPQPE
jgi:hypothetical protein